MQKGRNHVLHCEDYKFYNDLLLSGQVLLLEYKGYQMSESRGTR